MYDEREEKVESVKMPATILDEFKMENVRGSGRRGLFLINDRECS